MEEFQQIDIVRFVPKMRSKEEINCRFKHEWIVNRNRTDILLCCVRENHREAYATIPTGLSPSRDGIIHNIIRNKEISLQLRVRHCNHAHAVYQFNSPAENTGLCVNFIVQGLSDENLVRVDDGHASIQFAAGRVVIQILFALVV